MGPFDYLFSFYGLLLGIAVANVAIGFADMWRDREKIAMGSCPPLIASSVLLGGINIWLEMWHTRPYVTVNGTQMLVAVAISLPYVFVSRAIFPSSSEGEERSLEDHYLKHRGIMLLLLAIPIAISVGSHVLIDKVDYTGWEAWWAGIRIVVPLALIPFANRYVQRGGLSLLNVLQLVGLFR
jgi:hypothetical protein